MSLKSSSTFLTQRINQNLFCLVIIVSILVVGRVFLIPLTFAILLSMLMVPICRYFDKKGTHRALSVSLCVFILLITLLAIATIVGIQIISVVEELPQIKERANQLLDQIQAFTQQHLNISSESQNTFVKNQIETASKSLGEMITGFFTSLIGALTGIVLVLVYTFLLLYHKERYEKFFLKMFKHESGDHVKELLNRIGHVSQHYLRGRTISILILSVLYSVGLLLVGIKHAILLGCIASLLTVIPYVGTVLGGFLPFIMALINEPSWTSSIWAAAVVIIIQAIDNYFIEPYVVGGEVNLSALATILSLIAGGLIWGIAGMILFIPMLGITKIIFDNIDKLKPLGFLIGDPQKSSKEIKAKTR